MLFISLIFSLDDRVPWGGEQPAATLVHRGDGLEETHRAPAVLGQGGADLQGPR